MESASRSASEPTKRLPDCGALLRLSEVLAALRDEVARAAASGERSEEGPAFMLSSAEFEISYVVTAATAEGIWVAIHGEALTEARADQVNRLRLSVMDIDAAGAAGAGAPHLRQR
jgi:hypothetical protein